MGILEDTAVKAKDAFDVVAKKTGEVWSVQKLKFNVAALNSQISKDFETLGRLYYDSLSGETADITEAADGLRASIEEKKAQIAEFETEIETQKKISVCPDCGAKNSTDALFCNKCGKKLN